LGGRKGIRLVKNMGGCGCGGVISPDGVAPTRTAGASASIITPALQKSRRMMAYNNIDFEFKLTPWEPPHAYVNRRWGNPA